ncbi:hypothetical protein F8388_024170 [Cannabis sativa]|uniref:Uncharacterized protein n=1 Tax=Cannabis sativa TaxID=3483 RepID=A0A7J6FKD0_CANSA|nr:hypothetical protein F8388_020815 [Cannabis sativa]KAF4371089.1 hypothetical protein F8388_020816 [Cannabis sativa]KAF4371090.1 hypothetical protein F8388_020817 [Cannabis sativa]KAF4375509.1 hypothetical protein F8388_024168 [Cannabis sativa]KAF4375510.1 hypothetical protein F8388_024169 [Cannabis sativa]
MSSVVKSLEPLSGLTRDLSVPFVYVVPTELGREEKVDHDDEEVVLMSSRTDDYCPSLKLEESDFVMPRKNFPLWRLIANDPFLIKAKIHEWSDGEEFQKVLLKLINTITSGDEIESVFTATGFKSIYQAI